jgi:hypothetical protein
LSGFDSNILEIREEDIKERIMNTVTKVGEVKSRE